MIGPLLLLLACTATTPPEGTLPPDPTPATTTTGTAISDSQLASLYALDVRMRTQAGTEVGLDVERGHPVLFSMFYTSCPMACPLLIQDIHSLQAGLSPRERAELRVVLISLDPKNDGPAALREVVEQHQLDDHWTLGAVPADRVIEVAAALNVRYRPLPEGGFAHTSSLTLVDGQGRIVAHSEGPEGRPALIAAIPGLVKGP